MKVWLIYYTALLSVTGYGILPAEAALSREGKAIDENEQPFSPLGTNWKLTQTPPPSEQLSPSPSEIPLPDTETPLLTPDATVRVNAVNVVGSTVFSEDDFAEVISFLIGKEATFEDLLAIRSAITNLYTSQGYTTSGAFLPPQDVSNGVITVQVIEGELEEIEIEGLIRLNESYVRSRLALAGKAPVNINQLEESLQLLQLNPLFERVQAELKAGTSPGKSILILSLTEAPAFSAAYLVENRDSPSVGSVRHNAILTHQNLLGWGDNLSFQAGFTEGVDSYNINYEIPVNPRNGIVEFRYSKNDQVVIEEPFNPLDLVSHSENISLGFRQPLIYTPTQEFTLGLSATLRESQTFLFEDIPFSFSLGPENGESRVTVLRLSQDWTQRSLNRVVAVRSQFNVGIDAFNATINEDAPDGRFFSWIGQFQWVQALNEQGVVAISRLTTQLTPDSLLPLEQFSIGGIDTVRGYRQNQRVADNGIVGSVEVRFPIVNKPDGVGLVQVAPFFDVGTVWNNESEVTSPNTLVSTGVGLRWQINPGFEARLDWGIPLNEIEQPSNTLQDNGIFFSIFYQPS
ncbi:MAG: ShlB/FhaC/HecB family hemolysin secretion/activation protein [Chroococcales cyanobacterium]